MNVDVIYCYDRRLGLMIVVLRHIIGPIGGSGEGLITGIITDQVSHYKGCSILERTQTAEVFISETKFDIVPRSILSKYIHFALNSQEALF